ncbi:MAG TPA: ATP-binding protein [Burkholderiaceae bacterium]|nr:ATP-binding protein [Burkholderiaceae bacterium]
MTPPGGAAALPYPQPVERPADPLQDLAPDLWTQIAAERDALARSEARFRAALVAGRMGSWETDFVAGTRHWSQEGMVLFGLSLPNGRGQVGGDADEYVAAIHPDDRHRVAAFYALADRQDSFDAEYRIVRPDGTTLWLQGRGLVVARGADGKAQRLISIMGDASERKETEERLRIERERLGLALTAGQMGAFEMDFNANTLWWSPQMYALFGVDAARFEVTPKTVLTLLQPDDAKEFLRVRNEAIAQHRPFVFEFRVQRAGVPAWLHLRGQASYDADGKPWRSFGVMMDVTDRKQIEQVLRAADRNKDDFIAILAHELRNPLAPIRNAIHVLRELGSENATATWCHAVLDRQVGQMTRLLDDLLDVSRLSRGQLKLRLEPLQLATAIEHAVEIARPVVDAGRHTLQVTMPQQPLWLQGDPTRLAQVFSNVLINAAKYTPPGGTITLTVQEDGAVAEVRVTDTGIGIAAEHMAQIFQIFGQVSSSVDRAQGGQGIGLALSKGLIEMHGGTIEARSEGLGKGSEFVLRLPLVAA